MIQTILTHSACLIVGAVVGIVALALVAALLAVALGFAGAELSVALDPVVEAVLEGSPEVAG